MALRMATIGFAALAIAGVARAQEAIRVEIPQNVATCSATVRDLEQGLLADEVPLPACALPVRGATAYTHPFELTFAIAPAYPQVSSDHLELRFIVPSNVRPSLRGFTIRLPAQITASGLDAELARRKSDLPSLRTKDLADAWESTLWAYFTRYSTSNGYPLTSHDGRKRDLESIVATGCGHLRDTPPTAAAMYASLQEGVLPICRSVRGNAYGVIAGFNSSAQGLRGEHLSEAEARSEALALRLAGERFAAEAGLDMSVLAPTMSATSHVLSDAAIEQSAPLSSLGVQGPASDKNSTAPGN